MSKNNGKSSKRSRRSFPDEFKEEAVQMLLDGHSASSVCQRLGLSGPNLLYRGKKEFLEKKGVWLRVGSSVCGSWRPSCVVSSGSVRF